MVVGAINLFYSRAMKLLSLAALLLACLAAAPAARAASATNGKALYDTFCSGCHGSPPRGGPEKAAGLPSVIRDAINVNVPAMSTFRAFPNPPPINQRGFTDAQLADIAEYLLSLALPAPGPAIPEFDYTDLWWNASESGWGMNIIQHASHNIFGVIYTYDVPNRPMWFVLPGGTWTSSTTFTGKIYRVTGSPGNMNFKPGDVTELGDLVLLFTDEGHATLDYTVNAIHTRKSITRQPF